jgi:Asp-tRNA(Asn)/Glu-tRNA(Gln) amidotransferase A subunit family amidase
MSDLVRRSAAEMAWEIRHKKISPRELIKAHLDRIERVNPGLNAVVYVAREAALRAAAVAEELVHTGCKRNTSRRRR